MPGVYDHHLQVRPEEIDILGHVNNLAYLRWMVDAALAHSHVQGWDNDSYLKLGHGWVVRGHEITYLRSAMPNDAVIVRTWIADWSRVTSRRRYLILRRDDEAVLARAMTHWAYIDFKSGKPRRIPEEVSAAFVVVGDEPPGLLSDAPR
ncbi:MAG: acyl-CoA thioesterase [Pirellulales bacterium]|nr:acyl-CoA thioesterase [Pirellulales bacterium]